MHAAAGWAGRVLPRSLRCMSCFTCLCPSWPLDMLGADPEDSTMMLQLYLPRVDLDVLVISQ
jgi:hypothetical protein